MSLHDDLTRVVEDARDHSRKDFNVVKESYGQYLARAILASDVIAQVRAEERAATRQAVIECQIAKYGTILHDVLAKSIDLLDDRAALIEKEN